MQSRDAFIEGLSRKRSLPPEVVLSELSRDGLKSLWESLGLDTSEREKELLIDRLLNNDPGAREQAAPYTVSKELATHTKRKAGGKQKDKSLQHILKQLGI